MNKRVDMRDVDVSWLNIRCLSLISSFAQTIYQDNGTVINLRAPDVLAQVLVAAKRTENRKLLAIYKELKSEIRSNLSRPENIEHVASVASQSQMREAPKDKSARFLRF